jgi:hypothetical protein
MHKNSKRSFRSSRIRETEHTPKANVPTATELAELTKLLSEAITARTNQAILAVLDALDSYDEEETVRVLYRADPVATAQLLWICIVAGLIAHEAEFTDDEITSTISRGILEYLQRPPVTANSVEVLANELQCRRRVQANQLGSDEHVKPACGFGK